LREINAERFHPSLFCESERLEAAFAGRVNVEFDAPLLEKRQRLQSWFRHGGYLTGQVSLAAFAL